MAEQQQPAAGAGSGSSGLPPGWTMTTTYVLEVNTASIAKTIRTYSFDETSGNKLTEVDKTIKPLFFEFVAGGSLFFGLGDARAVEMTGRFSFTIAATSGYVEMLSLIHI